MGRPSGSACGCRRPIRINDIADSNPAATFSTAVGELNGSASLICISSSRAPADPVAAGEMPDIGFFRKIWRGPLIANKGYDLARANAVLRDGTADLVSFAALYLANPDLPALPPRRPVQCARPQDVLRRRGQGLYGLSRFARLNTEIYVSNINILSETSLL